MVIMVGKLIVQAVRGWIDDRASSMGAALAFYTLFSMAPLLLIVISIAGLLFGTQAAQGEIFGQLRGIMGDAGAMAIQGILTNLHRPQVGVLSTIVGVGVLLIGASTVVSELKQDLDLIWRSDSTTKSSGLLSWLTVRLLAVGVVLGLGFLLLVSLLLSAALAAFGHYLNDLLPSLKILVEIFNTVFSYLTVSLLFALLYKFIPSARILWRDAIVAALITSLLFSLGKVAIGIYIAKSGVVSLFGASGGVVVVLLWIYYSAQIFLLGAELGRVLDQARRSGPPHPATHGAVRFSWPPPRPPAAPRPLRTARRTEK